jgi:hypothetical protein
MSETGLRVLAIRCDTSSCCPAIMESPAAVVIPKNLLLEACDVMLYGNIKNGSPDHSRV